MQYLAPAIKASASLLCSLRAAAWLQKTIDDGMTVVPGPRHRQQDVHDFFDHRFHRQGVGRQLERRPGCLLDIVEARDPDLTPDLETEFVASDLNGRERHVVVRTEDRVRSWRTCEQVASGLHGAFACAVPNLSIRRR